MPQIVNTPNDLPRRIRTLQICGTPFRYRLTWLERRKSWYFDLLTLDETPIMVGRRISPPAAVIPFNVPGFDKGGIAVQGLDQYDREDLGDTVQVFFVSAAELEAATESTAPAYTVVFP